MKIFIVLSFLILTNCFAQSAKVVKKGDIVPFDGVLFTRELEKQIRFDIQILEKKSESLAKIVEINEKEINILNKRIALYQEKANELATSQINKDNSTFFKNTLYFVSGAVITGVIGYGLIQAYR